MSAPLSPSHAESQPSQAAQAGDLFHLAFYKFVALADPAAVVQTLRTLTQAHGDALTGSILVASEGINGMLAGSSALMDAMEQALWHDSALKGAFTGMVFKRTACKTVPFRRMKVHLKAEIVPLGIDGVDATAMTGINVSPRDLSGNLGPIEQSLIGAPIADPTDPVEVGHCARSFDSCLVCTVHAYDEKSGKELSRFRIGETG